MAFTLAVILTTLVPAIGRTGPAYALSMLLAGGFLLYHSLRLARSGGSRVRASRLLHASVIYLPVVLTIMALGKR